MPRSPSTAVLRGTVPSPKLLKDKAGANGIVARWVQLPPGSFRSTVIFPVWRGQRSCFEMAERLTLPVLPLREVVLFPGVTAPIGAGRPATLRAIESALTTPDRLVFAGSHRPNGENVNFEVPYTI